MGNTDKILFCLDQGWSPNFDKTLNKLIYSRCLHGENRNQLIGLSFTQNSETILATRHVLIANKKPLILVEHLRKTLINKFLEKGEKHSISTTTPLPHPPPTHPHTHTHTHTHTHHHHHHHHHHRHHSSPFCWQGNFQSQILKRGNQKKNQCLGGLKEFMPLIFSWKGLL